MWRFGSRERRPKVSRVETIGGKQVRFEAANALELEQQIAQAYREATTQSNSSEPPRDSAGRFTKQPTELTPAQRAQLDAEFKRGLITSDEFISRSGAVDSFLAKHGASMDDVNTVVNSRYENDWKSATETFLASAASEGWPGGERNLKLIGTKLIAMGLTESPDKVAAITRAYNALRADGTLFPPEETSGEVSQDLQTRFQNASSPEEILRLARESAGLPSPDQSRDNTWFGR